MKQRETMRTLPLSPQKLPRKNISLLFPLVFGIAMVLYTNQPWSPQIYQIPLQVILIWGLFIFVVFNDKHSILSLLNTYSTTQKVCLVVIAGSILYADTIDSVGYLKIVQFTTGLMISLLTIIIFQNGRFLLIFILLLSTAAATSGMVAIMQHFGMADFSWERTMYFINSMKRPCGLEAFPVSFAFSVLGIQVFLFGIILSYSKIKDTVFLPIYLLFFMFMIISIGLLVTESRSGNFGFYFALITIIYSFSKHKIRIIPIPLYIIPLWLLIFVVGYHGIPSDFIISVTSDSRFYLTWNLFLPIIIDYPLGVSSQYPPQSMSLALLINKGYYPHNLFLTTSLHFGILGGISLIIFYSSIFIESIKKLKICKNGEFSKTLIIILLATNIAIVIHSFFHNANIVLGEMRNWVWIGALIGVGNSPYGLQVCDPTNRLKISW